MITVARFQQDIYFFGFQKYNKTVFKHLFTAVGGTV